MLLRNLLLVLFIFISVESFAIEKSAWDRNNNPDNIAPDTQTKFEYNFQKLPTQGQLDFLPWADSYCQSYQRGIAYRWNGNDRSKKMPKKNKVLKMGKKELAKLSPAEKYDIYTGDYNYSLTKSELNRTSADAPTWEGLCHGWAPASLVFTEPNPVTLQNEDGVNIPFGSSDIKALLTYVQGQSSVKSYMAGDRCEQDLKVIKFEDRDDPCLDINAGSFHVILANRLGILKKGFVLDVETSQEVWNHPVYAYQTKITKTQKPTEDAAKGTVKEIVVNTSIQYRVESYPYFESLVNETNSFTVQKDYDYILELDKNGNIIGGKWISTDYPDFLWTQKKAQFSDDFKALEEIYNEAIK